MERFISMDLTAVLWKTGRADLPEVVVASAYFDIELANTVPRELERLLRYCSRQGKRVLLLADTNAHSSMWGCDDTNRRGEDLEDFILGNDLAICNIGNHRTFFNQVVGYDSGRDDGIAGSWTPNLSAGAKTREVFRSRGLDFQKSILGLRAPIQGFRPRIRSQRPRITLSGRVFGGLRDIGHHLIIYSSLLFSQDQ
jgi:hypothetical protein